MKKAWIALLASMAGCACFARDDVRQVFLAASDSRPAAKATADYVCTGTNDELVIQRAIDDCAASGRQLFAFAGLYRLDAVRDFGDDGPRAAVVFRNMHRAFAMTGESRQVLGYPKGVELNAPVFYLRQEALPADGESVDIFRGEWSKEGILNGSALNLENVAIWAPDSQHNLRALDLQRVNSLELRNVKLSALGKAMLAGLKYPYGNPPPPVVGNIGVTLTDGSNNVPVNLVNVSATGFGQGFQVGGEHVVMVNCAATFGLYGFTFGNYPYHCAFNHPITMVNCCDEQNVNMPLFASCGDNGGALHGLQEVTMVSFNFERVAAHVPGKKLGDLMRETRPGSWRGQIGFTTQPEWNAVNSVDLPLWAEDGSGTGFRTVNNAHKLACTSAERRRYYPQYMQQLFDLDLNKLLICTDPAKRKWVDALGNAVDQAYVPVPQPVKSDVEITAIYYPGTEQMSEWDVIAGTCPERKPLLGWFDEGNPEAIDWQIKWAVEHGITSFCVDWYWNKGYRRLEHWLKGYYRARYRGYLKWFMMYANHNQPGSHSTEDQVAVTKYWIDNYFKTPEYYTIDGMPAVCIWDAGNLDRDFIAEAAAKGEKLKPGEGIKRAFAISEKMVREAGLHGICWIDMWRTKKFDAGYAKCRVGQGYRAAIHYGIEHYSPDLSPEAMKPGDTRNRFSYDAVVATAPKIWNELSLQETLPYWVVIPTGWDDRPRSFAHSRVITGRTVEKFAEICRQAKAFCDRHGKKHAIVMPINEWQEGSYIEPNEEYGFGMYDAIRDAFCEKPAGGWPKNVLPRDVGMGPYDYPPSFRSPTQRWDFADSVEGWYRQPYGGGELEAKDGCLNFWVNWSRRNFNIRQRVVPFEASKYTKFRVRMRVTPNEKAGLGNVKNPELRLKWGTAERPIVGPGVSVNDTRCVASCPIKPDGEFHEYELDLAANRDWRGVVDELWFEACAIQHARAAIDWMRFE